jgi:tripartite-type tricarboxylate transporter receptor subunit TctC
VVVENRGGGATNIGTESVVRADPDGYTMLLQSMPLAVNRFLFPSLGYDAISDLAPVSLLCEYANIMAVPMTSPAHSVADFIAYAKTNKGKVTFASSGHGHRCISPASCSSAWPASRCCTFPIAGQGLRSTTFCPDVST